MKIHHTFHGMKPDKWYKTLPSAEMLPRNEALGSFIFVCNNETMQEDLCRQLFITFIYFEMKKGSDFWRNIDPTAWEDKKFKGESRFPAQVRIQIKKKCKPLEEDEFRPILHHNDGPKF
ncbi:b2 protein [Quercus suber]|uniref:B2 protein n=1 Tax=Quercus suber TaxID=58331 RepID=A0AAW0K7Y0_QUESU